MIVGNLIAWWAFNLWLDILLKAYGKYTMCCPHTCMCCMWMDVGQHRDVWKYWFPVLYSSVHYCALYLLSAWRRGTLMWKICECNAACHEWWCKVGFLSLTFFLVYCLNRKMFPLNSKMYSHCRYLHFDFHQICGHIHFERLSMLYEKIEDFLEKNGFGFSSYHHRFRTIIMMIALE